jgi:Tol biopolymer transport system component
MMVEGQGRVFTKKELMDALWPETFVEDGSLQFQIASLRRALGEEWIETLPRYGYRFKGEISEIRSDSHAEMKIVSEDEVTRSRPPDVEVLHTAQLEAPGIHYPRRVSRPMLLYGFVLLALLPIVYFVSTRGTQPNLLERVIRLNLLPPEGVTIADVNSISVSPNGEQIVFQGVEPDGKKQLWLRPLGSLVAERIQGTEQVDGAFWSPNSRAIAYFSAGKLKVLDLQSGTLLTICDTPLGTSSGTWNRDGVILFHSTRRSGIYRVSAKGGQPQLLDGLSSLQGEMLQFPQFLPDGIHFIYFLRSAQPENTGVYVSSLGSKGRKRLVNTYTNAVLAQFSGSSYLLYTKGSDLVAQSFDLAKLELVGTSLLVARQIVIEHSASALISASTNGVLAYRTWSNSGSRELVWFDREGRRTGTVGDAGGSFSPSLSPDEKRLVVSRPDPQLTTYDLWLVELSTGNSTRFTFGPTDEYYAAWSPDGSRVAFNAVHDTATDIYEKPSAGISGPKLLLHSSESKPISGWSPDGRYLLYEIGSNTWALPMDGNGKPIGPYPMRYATISPNGKWVAYTSDQSGRNEVFVQSFPSSEGKWQVSINGGTEPVWRKDGKELFYISGSALVAVNVKTEAPAFEAGLSKPLFKVNLEARVRRRYQVAANGQRFLFNVPVEGPSPITVVLNWPRGAVRQD